MSHVVLTWPALVLDSNETLRIIAVTMVMMPTMKTRPMLIFSTKDIFKFQSTRMGTAITAPISSCQQGRIRGILLKRSVAKSAPRLNHRLISFARASRGVAHSPAVNQACMEEQLVKLLMQHPMNVRIENTSTAHQILLYSGNPSVSLLNMNSKLHLTAHRVNQKNSWTTKNSLSITTKSFGRLAYGCICPAVIAMTLKNVGIVARYSAAVMAKDASARYMKMSSISKGIVRILYHRAPVRRTTKTIATQRHATRPCLALLAASTPYERSVTLLVDVRVLPHPPSGTRSETPWSVMRGIHAHCTDSRIANERDGSRV